MNADIHSPTILCILKNDMKGFINVKRVMIIAFFFCFFSPPFCDYIVKQKTLFINCKARVLKIIKLTLNGKKGTKRIYWLPKVADQKMLVLTYKGLKMA